MQEIQVLNAQGCVVVSGCVCPLCLRLRPSEQFTPADIGQPAGEEICIDCLLDFENACAFRDPGEPLPYELSDESESKWVA